MALFGHFHFLLWVQGKPLWIKQLQAPSHGHRARLCSTSDLWGQWKCTAGVESRIPANRHTSLAISVPGIAFLFSRTNMLSPRSRASDLLPAVSPGSSGTALPGAACQGTRRIHPKWQVPEKQLCGACLLVSWCVFFFFFLLCRLISDEISQFYFNCCWQHVVSDKKHIFCRDCIHQLG